MLKLIEMILRINMMLINLAILIVRKTMTEENKPEDGKLWRLIEIASTAMREIAIEMQAPPSKQLEAERKE
jgi:hypothetical protein